MDTPRHTSLEAQFRAAVPPPRVPRMQRLVWRMGLKLLSLSVVQRIFVKKNRA